MVQFKIYGSGDFTEQKTRLLCGLAPNNKKHLKFFQETCKAFLKKRLIKKEILKKNLIDDFNKQAELGLFKGYRHKIGLPVNGQKTHNNRRTQRALYRKRLHL